MIKRISITDAEIAAHVAEAHVRRYTKYPRCDCDDNKQLEKKWKEDAKADVCGFLKGQFGKEPRLLDMTDKRAIKRDCLKYLPKDKSKMLTELKGGRPPKTFWADFCESTHKYEVLPPEKILKLFKSMYPAKNSKAKTLTQIVLSEGQRKRVMSDALLMVRLDAESRRTLGLNIRVRQGAKEKTLSKLSPTMSLPEAEDFIMRGLNAVKKNTAYRDTVLNRIVVPSKPRVVWMDIAKKLGSKLPQKFLDKYSDELTKRKAGKKKRAVDPTQPLVLNTKPAKKKAKLKLVKKQDHARVLESQNKSAPDASIDVNELAKQNAPVPGKIVTRERLNQFINNVMRKHDSSYGLSTEISRWSNPEWSMVDVYRDSIAPALLEQYSQQIEQARRILGVRSGGAYASIRNNRQLCVAHVVASWLCGELQ